MKEGECHELTCNSHVVLLQLQRQPAVPMKRKRRYCEFPELDVLSSGVADGSDQYSYTVSDSVSLSLYVFLFHSGRLKERTLSSHQTAVSSRHWRLIHFREEFSFENGSNLHVHLLLILLLQEENSSDITSLFPHLDMEPLTSSERYGKNTAVHISR